LSWAINAEMRKGKPHTRGAWVERLVLPFGNVQGAKFFSFGGGMAVVGIKGKLYKLTPLAEKVEIESIGIDGIRSPQAPMMWMEQTTDSLVIQDGISRPLIYNGVFARPARDNEVPLGKQMAYGNGRLWVAQGDGQILAGDIVNGRKPQSELLFNEDATLFAGGAYQAPGKVRAMKFMPSNEVATANGPLIVGGIDFMMSLKAHITDRQSWATTIGFNTTIFPGEGIISHTAMQTANLDVFYRDDDGGIRTFRQATADFEDAGTSPISEDVSRITDHENTDMLESCPALLFQNRLLMGGSPFRVFQGCVAFRHLISYDLAPLATRGKKGQPIFDGQWEGHYVTQLFNITQNGLKRAFAITKALDGENRLYEYVPSRRADEHFALDGVTLVKQPIQWQLFYPDLKFDSDLQYKRFRRLDLWITEIQGDVNIKTYYVADERCDWKLIHDDNFCACKLVDKQPLYLEEVDPDNKDDNRWKDYCKGVQPQIMNLTPEELEGDEWLGYKFRFRFVITGECQIDKMLAWAEPVDADVYSDTACRIGASNNECQFIEVTEVAGEYVITTVVEPPSVYEDDTGASYEDDNAEEYED